MGKHANVMICGDSKLIINQVIGKWSVRMSHLQILQARCLQLIDQLKADNIQFGFRWLRRDKNKAGVVLEHMMDKEKRYK